MYELKKNGKLFTSKFVATGPSSYKKNLPGRGLTKVESIQHAPFGGHYTYHLLQHLRILHCGPGNSFSSTAAINNDPRVISGSRHEEDENCALLGCYAASSGNKFFYV